MLKRGDIVFIDTTAIAAAHTAKAWGAVRKGFKLITAVLCVEEACHRRGKCSQSGRAGSNAATLRG